MHRLTHGFLVKPALAAFGCVLLAGCLAVQQVKTTPGTNLNSVKGGATRSEVEALLGGPLRTWRPNERVVYRLYAYQRPLQADYAGAGFIVTMDVISAGMWELLFPIGEKKEDLQRRPPVARLWLSFDANDRVLGSFREMDVLPEDGLPARPSQSSTARR
jgi:hypothetical protein